MIAPATACSRSASSKTMKGALPPSSSETFLIWPAHCAISSFPTSVEPVKPSLRTIGLEVISPPIAGASSASPVTTEKTPGGTPASSASAATASAESGVCSAGFKHHRAADGERRRRLARRHRRGEVPRRDPRGDADRLAQRDDPAVRQRLRDHPSVEPLRLLAEPLVERGGIADLELRLGERLPLLPDEERGQVVGALEHQVGEPPQDPGPVLRRAVLPGRQRTLGGLDRAPRLGGAHARDVRDRGAGGRIDDGERGARVGVDPRAVDVGAVVQEIGFEGGHACDDSSGARPRCDTSANGATFRQIRRRHALHADRGGRGTPTLRRRRDDQRRRVRRRRRPCPRTAIRTNSSASCSAVCRRS